MISKLFFIQESGEITPVRKLSKDLQIELLKNLLDQLPLNIVQIAIDDWSTKVKDLLMPFTAENIVSVFNPKEKSDVIAFCTLLDVTVHQLRNFTYMAKKNQTVDKQG